MWWYYANKKLHYFFHHCCTVEGNPHISRRCGGSVWAVWVTLGTVVRRFHLKESPPAILSPAVVSLPEDLMDLNIAWAFTSTTYQCLVYAVRHMRPCSLKHDLNIADAMLTLSQLKSILARPRTVALWPEIEKIPKVNMKYGDCSVYVGLLRTLNECYILQSCLLITSVSLRAPPILPLSLHCSSAKFLALSQRA